MNALEATVAVGDKTVVVPLLSVDDGVATAVVAEEEVVLPVVDGAPPTASPPPPVVAGVAPDELVAAVEEDAWDCRNGNWGMGKWDIKNEILE